MINFKIAGVKIRLTFLFTALLTVILLLDKSGLVLWGLIAAFMHEIGHIIAFIITGNKPCEISMEISGIKIVKANDNFNYAKEAVLLLSGPIINFGTALILYLTNNIGIIFYIHFMLGIFNMLPISVLDGGKLLKLALLYKMDINSAENFIKKMSYIIIIPLFIGGIILSFNMNFTLLITSIYLFIIVL